MLKQEIIMDQQQLIIILDIAYTHGKNDMCEAAWIDERTKILKRMSK